MRMASIVPANAPDLRLLFLLVDSGYNNLQGGFLCNTSANNASSIL